MASDPSFEFKTPVNSSKKSTSKTNQSAQMSLLSLPDDEAVAQGAAKAIAEGDSTEGSKAPKYSQEELHAIFDDIIFQGGYEETLTINGKLKVKFRTRTQDEISTITSIVDGTQATLASTLNEKRLILNLQYALMQYHNKDLSGLSVEDKASFLKKLPGPIIGSMLISLSKFDDKVYEACQAGEENF